MKPQTRSSGGFGVPELLVGMVVGLVAAAAIAVELRASLQATRTQDGAVDVVQRARALADSIAVLIGEAGGGFTVASAAGWVGATAPAIVPARFAVRTSDPVSSAFSDRFTVLAARGAPRSSTLAVPMVAPDALLTLAPLPGCRPASPACDLDVGDIVLVSDRRGHTDLAEITAVSGNLLAHDPVTLSHAYDPADDVRIVPLELRALVFDPHGAQLREHRGQSQALVLADDVVRFEVRYFGTPAPPLRREARPLDDTCIATADGQPRLPVLHADAGELVELTPERLRDGPFCGAGSFAFDADLLRVRLVRVVVRVQASDPAARGTTPGLFFRPGWAATPFSEVPDREVTFDVAIRNAVTVG